jgi:hypothetical protein
VSAGGELVDGQVAAELGLEHGAGKKIVGAGAVASAEEALHLVAEVGVDLVEFAEKSEVLFLETTKAPAALRSLYFTHTRFGRA